MFRRALKNKRLANPVYHPQLLNHSSNTPIVSRQASEAPVVAKRAINFSAVMLLLVLGGLVLLAGFRPGVTDGVAQSYLLFPTAPSLAKSPDALPFLPKHNPKVKITNKTQTPRPCQTTLNIVAHEDDDLLFINPRLVQALDQHQCVRTVYLTAGDDGRGTDYLYLRESGAEAAYDVMLNNHRPWAYQALELAPNISVTSASPAGNSQVTLIFLRLPDGNLNGKGFETTGFQSLAKLQSGAIPKITSLGGDATYTNQQLVSVLSLLMQHYRPQQINTQADDVGEGTADHSDHIATGQYAAAAANLYAYQADVSDAHLVQYFMGYPIRDLAPNLTTDEIQLKSAPFFAYAGEDPGVCTSMFVCENSSSYGAYLSRIYTQEH